MASCHTHATCCQSSHRIHRIHRSFWRRIFSHGIHGMLGCVIGSVGMAGCHTLLICAHPCNLWDAFSARRFCVFCVFCGNTLPVCLFMSVVVFSHGIHGMLGCVIGSVGMAGCHTLLICAHPCLSVGGTSLPEGSVCSACSVGTLYLFALLVLQRQLHQRGSILPRNSRNPQNVRLRYWRRGYGRDAIPS